MVKKSKLLNALDRHQNRDYDAEKRKKQVKAAEKRKQRKSTTEGEHEVLDDTEGVLKPVNGATTSSKDGPAENTTTDEFEAFPDDDAENDSEAGSDEEDEDSIIPQPELNGDASASEAEQDSDISYSDLEEEDKEDVVPHQRLTINNAPALVASRKRVAVVSDRPTHPFHYHNSLISADEPANTLIPDPMDDETRELMFYKIARDATLTARTLLKKEKIPFTRPTDYFAEMVKTEDHMGRIKKKLVDEASRKKAAEEARKLRDARKFGKQVQIAREQDRAKEKRETLDKIKELKRKRKGNDTGRTTEGDDLFQEINVDNKRPRRDADDDNNEDDGSERKRARKPSRTDKDKKFGFGGRKRFSKSGTMESSADMSSFSARRMKGGAPGRGGRGGGRGGGAGRGRGGASSRGGGGRGGAGGSRRLGKSRRTRG